MEVKVINSRVVPVAVIGVVVEPSVAEVPVKMERKVDHLVRVETLKGTVVIKVSGVVEPVELVTTVVVVNGPMVITITVAEAVEAPDIVIQVNSPVLQVPTPVQSDMFM